MKITYAQTRTLQEEMAGSGEALLLPLLDEEERRGIIKARFVYGEHAVEDVTISRNGHVTRRTHRQSQELYDRLQQLGREVTT